MNPFAIDFMRTALAASLPAGAALSLIGTFVLARRVSFSGLAIAQLAALGTAVGAVLNLHLGKFGVALALVGAGMALLSQTERSSRTPSESWVACLYILGAALSVLILSKAPQGEAHTLEVFFGNILSLGAHEVAESIALFIVTAAAIWIWFHRWVWLAFDPVAAGVSGIRTGLWNFFFFALFAAAMTVSIHIFGVLLAFAYLILPAAIGLMLVRKVTRLFALIPFITILATVAGFYFSFRWDFPTGPFIAATLAAAAIAVRLLTVL